MSDVIHIVEFYDREGETRLHRSYFLDKDNATDFAEEILYEDEDLLGFNIFNLDRSVHDFS